MAKPATPHLSMRIPRHISRTIDLNDMVSFEKNVLATLRLFEWFRPRGMRATPGRLQTYLSYLYH